MVKISATCGSHISWLHTVMSATPMQHFGKGTRMLLITLAIDITSLPEAGELHIYKSTPPAYSTWTDDSSVFVMAAVVDSNNGMGTSQKWTLIPNTANIIQKDRTFTPSKLRPPGGSGCHAISQHPAGHVGVGQWPVVITHGAPPLVVIVDLNTTFHRAVPISAIQTNLQTGRWKNK